MKNRSRKFGQLSIALTLLLPTLLPTAALAQKPTDLPDNYPNKPVRVIVGTGPAGGTDLLTRAIFGKIGEKWGATFVVENMASLVGGIRALDTVRAAPANGYIIMGTSSSTMQNAMFITKVSYDVKKEFIPTIQYAYTPLLMVIHRKRPVKALLLA